VNDYEKIYLSYILDSRGNESKIVFIGFLLTINLAFYAGLYYICEKFPFSLTDLQILILLLLIAINYLFSKICIREDNLDKVISRYVKQEYIEARILEEKESKLGKVICNVRKGENNGEDWENPMDWTGKSWQATKGMLSIVNATPFAVLFFWGLSFLCSNRLPCRSVIFVLIAILIVLLLYYYVIERFSLKRKYDK